MPVKLPINVISAVDDVLVEWSVRALYKLRAVRLMVQCVAACSSARRFVARRACYAMSLPIVYLHGTPYEQGRQHGAALL